jgi:monoamine oxidase
MFSILLSCKIAVIGAGLAGLSATDYLHQQGIDVKLFEALDRPGGRVHTQHTVSDQHYEVGALSFTDVEKTLFSYIDRFGLKYIQHSSRDKQFFFKGKKYLFSEKATFLEEGEQAIRCSDLLTHYLNRIDETSDLSFAVSLKKAGASPLAIEWLNQNSLLGLFGNGIDTISTKVALQFLKQYTGTKYQYSLKGGNDTLPKALARIISKQIIYNIIIQEVEKKGSSLILKTECGKKILTERVICAIPLSALKKINFIPPLSREKQTALLTTPYTTCGSIILECDPQYFSKKIEGGIFATIDNPRGWYRNQTLFQNNINENTIISFHSAGNHTLELIKEDQCNQVIAALRHFTPTNNLRIISKNTSQIQEGYSYGHPDTEFLQTCLAQPEGFIHFAGEHTSEKFASMNGALESGIRAAKEVLSTW